MKAVLDASALLAALKREPGYLEVQAALADGATMSLVNLSEVLAKLAEAGEPAGSAFKAIVGADARAGLIDIVPFDVADAVATAELRIPTRAQGLSLGDRACLALGARKRLPVLTTDREWTRLDLGIDIRVIR